jgi:primary-amine oxidase
MQSRHPLDPLTGDELRRAASLALAHLGSDKRLRLVDVSLHEPDKAALLAAAPIAREAWVVLLDRRQGSTHELVISLDRDTVVEARELADVQPAITWSESDECELLVRSDLRFQEALTRRGVTNFDLVTVEAWGMGTHADPRHRSRRLAWTPCWVREDADDNPYAHPIDGLHAIVDLNAMEVVEIEDHGSVPVPATSGRYRPEATGLPPRDGLRALEIVQPEGPSFTVSGWEVSWQSWRLRVGFTAREGSSCIRSATRMGIASGRLSTGPPSPS